MLWLTVWGFALGFCDLPAFAGFPSFRGFCSEFAGVHHLYVAPKGALN
jgi:hypothetical protein